MFPSVSRCASAKRILARRQTWPASAIFDFVLLLHLLRNYLTDSNETCFLCSPQCLVVQVQKKKIRSVDKFGFLIPGSDLMKFRIDRLVVASPPRPLVGFFRSWSECSPQCLVVRVPTKNPICQKTWPPSAIFDFSYHVTSETTGGFE